MATVRIIHIPFAEMKQEFRRVLLKVGFAADRADQLAGLRTDLDLNPIGEPLVGDAGPDD